MSYCQFCGWGSWIKADCASPVEAETCTLNLENCRKYALKNREAEGFRIVRSVRYQDPGKNKFGTYYERLEVVDA